MKVQLNGIATASLIDGKEVSKTSYFFDADTGKSLGLIIGENESATLKVVRHHDNGVSNMYYVSIN